MRPKRRHLWAFFALGLILPPVTGSAKDAALTGTCNLRDAETAKVRSVTDGDTLVLADGRQVRLVGTQAPKLPLGRRDFPTWPLAEESKRALEKLSLNQTLTLRYGGAERDRYRRVLAHIFLPDGRWIQQAMLEQGMARVYSFSDNQACIPDLLDAEKSARAAKRGIWALPFYAIRSATDITQLEKDEGTYQLVEGRVASASLIRKVLYINFGTDWKTDFTVRVSAANIRNFSSPQWQEFLADPDRLAGTVMRVRGWIGNWKGPEIAVTHPGQIELLNLQ